MRRQPKRPNAASGKAPPDNRSCGQGKAALLVLKVGLHRCLVALKQHLKKHHNRASQRCCGAGNRERVWERSHGLGCDPAGLPAASASGAGRRRILWTASRPMETNGEAQLKEVRSRRIAPPGTLDVPAAAPGHHRRDQRWRLRPQSRHQSERAGASKPPPSLLRPDGCPTEGVGGFAQLLFQGFARQRGWDLPVGHEATAVHEHGPQGRSSRRLEGHLFNAVLGRASQVLLRRFQGCISNSSRS